MPRRPHEPVAVAVGRSLGPVDAEVLFEAIAVLTVLGTLTQLGADTGLVRALRGGSR
jgi:hypothetical protein